MQNLENEIWKDIKELNSFYEISNYGNVRSKPRKIKSRIQNVGYRISKQKIKLPQDNGKGYKQLYVQINKTRKLFYIHRLVAKYFIENINNLPEVNHKDLNKSNNFYENLEWISKKENINHAIENGRFLNRKCKTPIKVFQIYNGNRIYWESAKIASTSLKIDESSIHKCCKGKLKSVKGTFWSY